jgi:hypothetical protein
MTKNYNKKRYLQLLNQRSMGDDSGQDELLRYSCALENQVEWEIRDQYLEFMEELLKENISVPEFLAELRIKNYSIIDSVTFLESHKILLSPDKKSSKLRELLEPVTDNLEGEIAFTEDEFKNLIQETFIKIKKLELEDLKEQELYDLELDKPEKVSIENRVLLPSMLFFSLVSCFAYCGLKPGFLDFFWNLIH